jgi:hypothetical protein
MMKASVQVNWFVGGKNVHPSWSTTSLQALDQDVVMAHN